MPIQIIDHLFAPWLAKKKQENGAATYSRDINDILMPDLISALESDFPEKEILISTAPPIARFADKIEWQQPDLIIQFLHSYPYEDSLTPIIELMKKYPKSKVVFVTAYHAYRIRINNLINQFGLAHKIAVKYQPMFINTKIIEDSLNGKEKPIGDPKRVIYFGNLYRAKSPEYNRIKSAFLKLGWKLDVISKSRLNFQGDILDQKSTWEIIRGYNYGIGVGRCALEMYCIGLQVLISGEHWGGICLDVQDFDTQQKTNFNGRIITGSRDLKEAMELLPISYRPEIITPVRPALHSGLIAVVRYLLDVDG